MITATTLRNVSMKRHSGKSILVKYCLVLAVCLLMPYDSAGANNEEDYFWRLGVGTYGTPPAGAASDMVLTHARFDWQMIAFGSQVDMPTINRCLELNPRQRFLVRLWPKRSGDSFLAYLYTPGVRERIDENIAAQINTVLENISHPEQVIAFTFLEELPSHWHMFWRGKKDDEVLAILEPYREAIEAEVKRTMVYDASLRQWLWDKYAESLDGIHAAIRAEAGSERLVLYWPRFDCFEVERIKKVVHQKGADGVFIYVLKPDRFREHVKIAEENRWPFFSQLSHNTGMKQASWDDCVELPNVQSRYNLGYFFYGGGNPLRPHFFDNPAVDRVNNVSKLSNPVHLRWFAADRYLGWDVFAENISFQPLLDLRPAGKENDAIIDLYALVRNPLLEGHYPDEANQKITDLTASLTLPEWLELDTAAAVVNLGELAPARHRVPGPGSMAVAHWRLRRNEQATANEPLTVSVAGQHPQLGAIRGRTSIVAADRHMLPAFQEQKIVVSGQGWMEPGFGLDRDIKPGIVMYTQSRPVPKPSLTDGEFSVDVHLGTYRDNAGFYRLQPQEPVDHDVNRFVYNGILPPHSTLQLEPDGRAVLTSTRPLLEKQFRHEEDPGEGVSSGYYLGAHAVNRPIPPGENVVIEVSGRREGSVNSHLIVYFNCGDTGARKGGGSLTNRFGQEWRRLSAEISPPFDNAILHSIALYRFPNNAAGTIWYGSLKADLASEQVAGEDVSALIEGELPRLRAGVSNVITYFDEDTQQPRGDKIRIQLLANPAVPTDNNEGEQK